MSYTNWEAFEWKKGKYVFDDSIPAFRRKLLETPLYTNGQFAFLATKDDELLQFDLNNGELVNRQAISTSAKLVNRTYSAPQIAEAEFLRPKDNIPNLKNGLTYHEVLEKEFDFKYDGVLRNDKFKYYYLKLTCLIDIHGKCLEPTADFDDAKLKQEIEAFFENQIFDATSVPEISGKWYFEEVSNFRRLDTLLAAKEKTEEIKWRNKSDSINGFYIPHNIEDCLAALNEMLTMREKEKFKSSFPMEFHHSLGTYLRHNWDLWQGSRLKKYFENLGTTHPDDMSSIILNCYWRQLGNEPYDLKSQLNKYNRIHVPQLIMPDSLIYQVR